MRVFTILNKLHSLIIEGFIVYFRVRVTDREMEGEVVSWGK